MNERLLAFAQWVGEHPGASASEAGAAFGVAERTVRKWILRANEEMGGSASIRSDAGAYTLVVDDAPGYEELVSTRTTPWTGTPATPEQRRSALLSAAVAVGGAIEPGLGLLGDTVGLVPVMFVLAGTAAAGCCLALWLKGRLRTQQSVGAGESECLAEA